MIKSASLISAALLVFGLASGSMAADAPKSAVPMAADTASSSDAPKATHKHKAKKSKKAKKAKKTEGTGN
jgi:anti-sigma factor RsiW